MTEKQFEIIYKQYSDVVYRSAMKRLKGNRFYAQEVVSYVFMKLWEKREIFANEKMIITWIWIAVRHKIIDLYRTNLYHRTISLEADPFLPDNSTEESIEYDLQIDEITRFTRQLTPKYRIVFNLLFVKELSPAEMCQELNANYQTIRNELCIIRRKFRKAISS